MADGFVFQQSPDLRIVDFPQTIMRTPHSRHRPWKRPPGGVEHRQAPEIMAPIRLGVVRVEAALNNIAHSSQIRASVSVNHTLRLGSSTRRVRQGKHTLLVDTLRLESVPTMPTSLSIKRQPLNHSPIKRPSELALSRISIRVNNHRNLRMALAETPQQVLELSIDDNRIDLGVVEDIFDILLLQPVIDGDLHSSRGSDAVDGFQEGGSVGG